MAYYVHATIELPGKKLRRGDKLSDADIKRIVGFEELVEGGSISEAEYDPKVDESPLPDVVEIDGVRYLKCSDDGELEAENAS